MNVARRGWRWGWGDLRESFEVVRGFGLRLCRGCLGYGEVAAEQLFWLPNVIFPSHFHQLEEF